MSQQSHHLAMGDQVREKLGPECLVRYFHDNPIRAAATSERMNTSRLREREREVQRDAKRRSSSLHSPADLLLRGVQ